MITKCCLFPVGFSVHFFFWVCFDSLVTICTKLELILKVCFDSAFTRGEFNHVCASHSPRGGWHEPNRSDQAEFPDGEAMPAEQNSLEGPGQTLAVRLAHPADDWQLFLFWECMNLMQMGFKIIKCMIYWKKHRREQSAQAPKRGSFFKQGALLRTRCMGHAILAQRLDCFPTISLFPNPMVPKSQRASFLLCEIAVKHIIVFRYLHFFLWIQI